MTQQQVIPEAAVEAAAKAYYEASLSPMEDDGEGPIYTPMSWERMDGAYRNATYVFPMRLALEAAAPHMLSHEREEARLAHVDAVVNAETVDKLNTAIEAVLDISNVRMDSEHGDPTFVAGWEAALEEVNARIKESTGGSDNE